MIPTRLSYLKDSIIAANNLSSNNTQTGYPLSNLTDENLWSPWRSQNVAGSQEILVSFSATMDINFFGLGFHNLSSNGTHLLKYGSNNNCVDGAATLDMKPLNFGYFAPSTLSYKYFKLSINESVADGYTEIGEMQMGLYTQVPYNPVIPIKMFNELNIDYIQTPGDNTRNYRKYMRKGWEFNFIEDNDRISYASLEGLWESKGFDIPFFLCPQPSTYPEDILYVRIETFDFHVDSRDSRPGIMAVKEAN